MQYDIFNGDADGICALTQLRLSSPQPDATLITGVKRDISLVKQVSAKADDQLTILDISLDKNRDAVEAALAAGATIFYSDHHFAGEVPEHESLDVHINTSANTCTSLIVNGLLKDAHIGWAITGAFGDNLNDSALSLAERSSYAPEDIAQLKELGILINYNGYGASQDDLHFRPAELYQIVLSYPEPLDFIHADAGHFLKLKQGYAEDISAAEAIASSFDSDTVSVYVLPDASWARRVSGVFGNQLANQNPDKAHAVVTTKPDGNYMVSVRAPLNNKTGADEFCRQYPSGGGRAAAAGINDLAVVELEAMMNRFNAHYTSR